MDMFNFETFAADNTQAMLDRVYQHWVDIIKERKSVEEFLGSTPIATPVPSKPVYLADIPDGAIESALMSEFHVNYQPKGRLNLGAFNSCRVSKRGSTEMWKIFSPLLKHVETERGHYVCGWYDQNNGNAPVGIYCVKTENDGFTWLKALEISEEYRGHGLGEQLLQAAIKMERVTHLAVHPDNKVALFMYDKAGFKLNMKSHDEFMHGKRMNVVMIRR